jgi:ribonucleotide reductase beta subunit family protein with ferritin-like domain
MASEGSRASALFSTPSTARLSLYPIEHNDIWAAYKQQLACFWTAEEIDFAKDREQWEKDISDKDRTFLKAILAFFAGSDSVVALNIMNNFAQEVDIMEAQVCYAYQAAMEGIHNEVYSIMIDTYIQDPDEKERMFLELGDMPSVRAKVAWAQREASRGSCSPSRSLSQLQPQPQTPAPADNTLLPRRLVSFCIVEGLFFSGAFCAIYWMKQRNLLPGLTKSNEFIARDEGQHTLFACILYRKIAAEHRMPQDQVFELMREAMAIEVEFITASVPCGLIGMNPDLMTQYVQFVADGLLAGLGYDRMFGSKNPFPFMDLIGMNGRSNFFEERVSQYQKAMDPRAGASGDDFFTNEF